MTIALLDLLSFIIAHDEIHAKWLNTLSYLENCGARKIAKCEHPTLVKETLLKHAAEEFRHAYYLKKQINRVSNQSYNSYIPSEILGGFRSLHYLNQLDVKTSVYLTKEANVSKTQLKEASYILVTYAIEKRADKLYPLYDQLLRQSGSKVTVKSIVLEEKGHLKEMEEELGSLLNGRQHAHAVCQLEEYLYEQWFYALQRELQPIRPSLKK